MTRKNFWKRLREQCFDIFFPILRCGGCGGKTSENYVGICDDCLKEMLECLVEYDFCPRCGSFYSPQFHSCPRCFDDQRRRYYSEVRSFCVYEGAASALVKAFKFRRALYLAEPMAKLMAGFLNIEEDGRFDFMVAVPLHPQRLKERGYNQSLVLTEALAEYLDLPVEKEILLKIKETPFQTSLSGAQRRENLKGAFAVTADGYQRLEGKRVILVDDVITTGSTLSECARILKQAGAVEVKAVTFAGSGRKFNS